MKNKANKPKRGTIGWEVAKLVKRYGNYTHGLTILEMALQQATQTDAVKYNVGAETVYTTKTPGYIATLEQEHQCWERMGYTVDRATGKITKVEEVQTRESVLSPLQEVGEI